jgi:hypothetical protein
VARYTVLPYITNTYAKEDMLLLGSTVADDGTTTTTTGENGQSKPLSEMVGYSALGFYKDTLGWDFDTVWKTTSAGGPIFIWETD